LYGENAVVARLTLKPFLWRSKDLRAEPFLGEKEGPVKNVDMVSVSKDRLFLLKMQKTRCQT